MNSTTCTTCSEGFLNGEIINGKFHCNLCILHGMVKEVVKKTPDHEIIDALKQCGLRGNIAVGYFKNPEYSLELLIKMVWLFRFIKSQNFNIINQRAYFTILIKQNKYPIAEGFWDWYKGQMANPRKNDFAILYKVL